MVKGAIITIDAIPFRQWYEAHYASPLARKKGQKLTEEEETRISGADKRSKKAVKKYTERQKTGAVEPNLLEQFHSGRLYGRIFLIFLSFTFFTKILMII